MVLAVFAFLSEYSELSAQTQLCTSCSQVIGGGFQDTALTANRLVSIVGMSAAGDTTVGNLRLISGYMPVCVMPFVTLRSNSGRDTLCADGSKQVQAQSYLRESLAWTKAGSSFVVPKDSIADISDTTLSPSGKQITFTVLAKKGKYQSVEQSYTVTISPPVVPQINLGTNTGNSTSESWSIPFCAGDIISFKVTDGIGTAKTTVQTTASSSQIISAGNQFTLPKLNNDTETCSFAITNSFGCTKNLSVTMTKRKPSVQLALPTLPTVNPANREASHISIPITFTDLDDFANCPPDSISVSVTYRKTLFLPDDMTSTTDSGNDRTTTKKIAWNNQVKVLDSITGTVLLGDVTSTPLTFKTALVTSASQTARIYSVSLSSGLLTIIPCGNGTNNPRLLIAKNGLGIQQIYPQPASDFLTIVSQSENRQTEKIQITNELGITIAEKSVEFTEGMNQILIELPQNVPNGLYALRISGVQQSIPFVIMK